MDNATRLTLLKLNVNAVGSTIYDELFSSLLDSAKSMIEREGITLNLDESTEDNNLVIGYAAYLFEQRSEPEMKMPRWLRYCLNNRLFSEKASV